MINKAQLQDIFHRLQAQHGRKPARGDLVLALQAAMYGSSRNALPARELSQVMDFFDAAEARSLKT